MRVAVLATALVRTVIRIAVLTAAPVLIVIRVAAQVPAPTVVLVASLCVALGAAPTVAPAPVVCNDTLMNKSLEVSVGNTLVVALT